MVKYQKAMPMVVELLKKKDVPMSVAEIHDALIWFWDMGIIRRAVRELLADGTIVQGFIKLGNEKTDILRMSLAGQRPETLKLFRLRKVNMVLVKEGEKCQA